MSTNKNQNKKIFNQIAQITLFSLALLICTAINSAKASEIDYQNVTDLINDQRTQYNLPKLTLDPELNHAADLKSKDMLNRNYFEHYAYGLAPWDFIKISGYDYLYAGENLAMDFNTSEGMVKAWMNSPAHRDNILNPHYTDMGIGIVKGEYTENGITRETVMVTNMFGRKRPAIIKVFDYITKNVFNIFQ